MTTIERARTIRHALATWRAFLSVYAEIDGGTALDLFGDTPPYIAALERRIGRSIDGPATPRAPIPHGALIAQLRNLLESLHPFDLRHVASCGICGAMDEAQRLVGDRQESLMT